MSKRLWYHGAMLDDRTRLEFPASGLAELQLRFTPRVLRCVAGGPGGHPLNVLLDTGTDPSAIDLGLARRLGLRLGDFGLGSDAASDGVRFTETVLSWLRLGDLLLRDLYALALDLGQAPFPVDLVLGYNVLSNLTLSVDYTHGRLRLGHPDLEPPEPVAGGATLPLQFFEHFPAIPGATLLAADPENGPAALRPLIELPLVTIDTGSNGALTLGHDLAALAGLHRGTARVAGGAGHGFTTSCDVLQARAAGLRLGPFVLTDIELDAPASPTGDLGRAGRANLGNGLLARFGQLTLDYRRALCVLGPPAPAPD